ncbi:MAG: tetratricopeptide repeat protein, partial [Planctomycetes bacterium]|nr:tetratricopeptide repeat protein [Planctomycetota bacterium]
MTKRALKIILISLVLTISTVPQYTSAQTAEQNATSRRANLPIIKKSKTTLSLTQARKFYIQGKYNQAIKTYKSLLTNPALAISARIGLAKTYAIIGRYDDAIKTLKLCAQRAANNADWHVLISELFVKKGNYHQAQHHARKAFFISKDWAPAIYQLGKVLEILGKKSEAIKIYKQIDRAVARKDFTHDARSLTAAGMVLARYATLTGQKASMQAPNILHNYFQRAYQEVDKQYWPANVAAGMFLLEKHNPRAAGQEFSLALKTNPRIPDALVGMGLISLQRWRFEQAIAQADKALSINPNSSNALLLKAAVYMQWRKFDKVRPIIDKVLKVNPNNLDALSLAAALYERLYQPEKAKPFIEKVEQINPQYALLYQTIARWLSAGRQFERAEGYYKKAIKLAPELAGPVTGLGLLYMQTGQEELAAKTLKKAAEIDDYRADVQRYLHLLKKLRNFKVKETKHFIIKVDGKTDAVLLDLLAEHAERIYPEICSDFDYHPTGKTLIELFPTHEDFSVRISGKGWIGTVGACTGPVIAMSAPDPLRGGFGSFNWAVVVRHEFTHTVTLAATKNRIPHWFTEACAVWEQPDRRSFNAVKMLVDAVRNNRLYPVKSLSWGFIRPSRRGARSLAYAQSEWIFEYIVETKGYETIVKMLKAFRDGWPQEKVFKEILGCSEREFDKQFARWAKKQIIAWGFDPYPTPSLTQSARMVRNNPTSAEAHANYARALFARGALDRAELQARRALEIDPTNARAQAVLGVIQLRRRKYDDAIETSKRLEKINPRSHIAAKIMA